MPGEAISIRVLHQRGEGVRAVPQGHGLEERVPKRPEAAEPPGPSDQERGEQGELPQLALPVLQAGGEGPRPDYRDGAVLDKGERAGLRGRRRRYRPRDREPRESGPHSLSEVERVRRRRQERHPDPGVLLARPEGDRDVGLHPHQGGDLQDGGHGKGQQHARQGGHPHPVHLRAQAGDAQGAALRGHQAGA